MKQYKDTNIDAQSMKIMDEEKSCTWDVRFSWRCVRMLFEGVAKYLGVVKKKGQTMGCQIRDFQNDAFYFGAYVESNESEDGEDSFSLTFTFNEEDMKDIPKENIAGLSDQVFHYMLADFGLNNYGICLETVNGKDFLCDILCACAEAIKSYMINNVDIDPVLVYDDFFKATAEHDGEKVYITITPMEVLKQHVKDDKVNEKAEAAA